VRRVSACHCLVHVHGPSPQPFQGLAAAERTRSVGEESKADMPAFERTPLWAGTGEATWCSTRHKAETEQVESLQCSVGHPASARCEDGTVKRPIGCHSERP
jgi:hypothetical protein